MDTVIFDLDTPGGVDFEYKMRCINPECIIRKGVKVTCDGETLIENGGEVGNFYSARRKNEFFRKMKEFAAAFGYESFIMTEKKGKVIKYIDLKSNVRELSNARIDDREAKYIKHIMFLLLAEKMREYPCLSDLGGRFAFREKS